jgi:DNA-directed RNA polymerase alpha subunit
MYKAEWGRLVKERESIAHYAPVQAIKSMKGIAMEKYHAMEHHYPARMAWIEKFGYDPKQLHHLLRVEDYIERYIAGESYESCLIPTPNKVLHMMEYKRQEIPYEIAKKEADDAIAHVTEMADAFAASVENIGKPGVDEILNKVQRDIMKFAIATELAEDEYYD